jgi:F0F1-type ATP synthase assembly protein I
MSFRRRLRFPKMGTNTGDFSHSAPLTLPAHFLEYASRRDGGRLPELIRRTRDRTMAAESDPQERRLWAVAMSASSALTGPAILGVLVDWALNSWPWGTVAGALLGMAVLFAQLLRLTQPKGPKA